MDHIEENIQRKEDAVHHLVQQKLDYKNLPLVLVLGKLNYKNLPLVEFLVLVLEKQDCIAPQESYSY